MPDTGTGLALILGASRGLGLGLARELLGRGWHVIATERGGRAEPLHDLAAEAGGRLEIERADINHPDQIEALRGRLAGRSLDLLFVNAGVANDPAETAGEVSTEEFTRILVTNALSPLRAIEALAPLVPAGGVIGAMSSGLGSVANNESGGWEVYRASKAALNTLLRSYAARSRDSGHALLLIAPGWVRTDMGGPDAALDVETSMRGVAGVIEARRGKAGLAYLDHRGQTVPW
ncbi:SDR family oxidoreductase [Roseomonas sp. NAR14]|uniref:SDR family oxidoreductase n=1 Tax=Roseomonas acroporae TaxID=2937791 RepID=A0A9X1Y662_9PROT|nr:SDR family NAD(P)-dependent oxidoreductase [Roseomonas acroporae]MCK8784969.1 SDR family oxidoreductase [Roseomonas acroporae]